MNTEDRKHIQRALRLLGFLKGADDGVFGQDTRTAIARWQARKAVTETGFLTDEQARVLRDYGRAKWVEPPKPVDLPLYDAIERCRSLCVASVERRFDALMVKYDEARSYASNERWFLDGERKNRDWRSLEIDRCIVWNGTDAKQRLANHMASPRLNPNCLVLR